jgi:hypothetical protein
LEDEIHLMKGVMGLQALSDGDDGEDMRQGRVYGRALFGVKN